ncbi:MAG: AarF/UbiB family protein [Acidobacteriota bacterium]
MANAHLKKEPHRNRSTEILHLVYRAFEIAILFAGHGISFAFRLISHMVFKRKSATARAAGEVLPKLFESLGATFIKIGQILSSRPDLLPPEIIGPLSRLQDSVAPFDSRKIPNLIEQAFGRPIDEIFESIDFTPCSSASIAQVHRARLKGGEVVALKIRRPGLLRKVESDLYILHCLVKFIELFPAARLVPMRGIAEEFGQAIRDQLDLDLEADNHRRIRRNLSDLKRVVIPRLYDDFCTESILTMEYLDGLMRIDALDFNPSEREEAAALGLQALYRMLFVDGLIHADMHPGNVFFRRGIQFILLDFGLVAKLEDSDLTDFAHFFLGMATNNGKECARIVHETATFQAANYDRSKFESEMVKLIGRHSSKIARDFEVTQFAIELFDTQRKSGIRGSTKFTMAIVSLVVFEGIAKQVYPDLDFQREARQFIPAIMSRAAR